MTRQERRNKNRRPDRGMVVVEIRQKVVGTPAARGCRTTRTRFVNSARGNLIRFTDYSAPIDSHSLNFRPLCHIYIGLHRSCLDPKGRYWKKLFICASWMSLLALAFFNIQKFPTESKKSLSKTRMIHSQSTFAVPPLCCHNRT